MVTAAKATITVFILGIFWPWPRSKNFITAEKGKHFNSEEQNADGPNYVPMEDINRNHAETDFGLLNEAVAHRAEALNDARSDSDRTETDEEIHSAIPIVERFYAEDGPEGIRQMTNISSLELNAL